MVIIVKPEYWSSPLTEWFDELMADIWKDKLK